MRNLKFAVFAVTALSGCAALADPPPPSPPPAPAPTFSLSLDEATTTSQLLRQHLEQLTAEYQKINAVLTDLQKQANDMTKKANEEAQAKKAGS